MPIMRVTAIFDHDNGLPRDQVANTFHMSVADVADRAPDVFGNLARFYSEVDPTEGVSIGMYISPMFNNVYFKAYEVNDEIVDGRVVSMSGPPVAVSLTQSLGARTSEQPMAAEVAACLSFRNLGFPAIPKARRTGRIYLGPFNAAALQGAAGSIARPSQQLLRAVRNRAVQLAADLDGDLAPWVIYSRPFPGREAIVRPGRTTLPALPARPLGATYSVDQIWTDDAFDTQRRRGERATAKTIVAV